MAFLLLLHEKMRLQRNYNKMTLRSSRLANRKARIANNITKVQKMYSNKMTQLEQSTKMLQNQFTMGIQNMFGLGTQNQMFNPMNMSGYGITSFVANRMAAILETCPGIPNKDGGYDSIPGGMDSNTYQQMLQAYMSNALQPQYEKDANGKVDTSKLLGYGPDADRLFKKEQYQVFMQAMSMAQQQQSQAQTMCQQMSSNYQMNISVWLEAQKTQIEAEQDAALAPLEAEQTDIDLEQASLEIQMEDARTRLDNLKQACSQGVKDSAPTFGLG